MKWAKRATAILALALAGCSSLPLNVPPAAETVALRLFSTPATAPLLRDLGEAYQQANPGTRFALRVTVNSDANVIAALAGAPPEAPIFALTNFLPSNLPLWAAPIGYDPLAVIVHAENPVPYLSTAQLQGIFEGRIANWAEVGGENRPITVISQGEGAGARLSFESAALGSRRITLSARLAPTGEAVVRIAGQDRGAIGYASSSLIDSRVRSLMVEGMPSASPLAGDSPFQAPILVVGQREPQGPVRAFIAWMQSPAGQAVVARRYHPL